MTGPEFSRRVPLSDIGPTARVIRIQAEPGERQALAERFDLAGLARLEAELAISRKGDEVTLSGSLQAEVTQSCVATGKPLEARIEAPFEILFRPRPSGGRPDEEVELGKEELDVVFHDGAAIDLGEAVAETLALSLDPYPRAPDADAALKAAGVRSEEEAGPFGALAGLRDKLKK